MAILKDEEEQKGQGTGQALAQTLQGQQEVVQQQEQPVTQLSGPSMGGSSATQTSAPVKAMPKQQKAGTGTFANLRSYLEAAQGGGQQRVAQAATQQVKKLGTAAEKGTSQALDSFRGKVKAGTLQDLDTAGKEAEKIIGGARAVTYQAPQEPIARESVSTTGPSKERTEPVTTSPRVGVSLPTEPTTPAVITPEAPKVTPSLISDQDRQRFADIINAQYQGPASLQQAGLYEQAATKARAAQQAAELTRTAAGREQLLKDVFGKTRDYRGKLDTLLLNASEQGVRQLQQQATPASQAQAALQEAQNVAANEAAQRAAAIEGVRTGARTAFTTAKQEEEAATEGRINKVLANWEAAGNKVKDLITDKTANQAVYQEALTSSPEVTSAQKALQDATNYLNSFPNTPGYRNSDKYYYAQEAVKNATQGLNRAKDAVKNRLDQVILSQAEANFLGVKEGTGFFGNKDILKVAPRAAAEELITKDEQLRLAALSQLAGLDKSSALNAALKYADAEKAGTKTIADVIDRTGTLAGSLEREKQFAQDPRLKQLVDYRGAPTPFPVYGSDSLYNILQRSGYNPESPSAATLSAITDPRFNNFLSSNNFYNRVNVEDRPELNARFSALQDYLSSIDPTYKKK
jgi:hypothetical protein